MTETHGGIGERLHRAGNELAQQHAGEYRECRENQRGHQELADEAPGRAVDGLRGEQRFQKGNSLSAGGEDGNARGVLPLGGDALHGRPAIRQGSRVQRRVGIDRVVRERTVVHQVDLHTHPVAERPGELVVQQQDAVNAGPLGVSQVHIGAQDRSTHVGGQCHERGALLGAGGDDRFPIERGAALSDDLGSGNHGTAIHVCGVAGAAQQWRHGVSAALREQSLQSGPIRESAQ